MALPTIGAVLAGEQFEFQLDVSQISGGQARGGLFGEKGIEQPVPARGQDALQLAQITFFLNPGKAVKTTQVEGKGEGARNALQLGHVSDVQVSRDPGLARFVASNGYGTRRKIDAANLPAAPGKGDDVGACAASQVDGAPGGMGIEILE